MNTTTIRTRNVTLTVIAAGYPGTRLAFHARVTYLGARIAAPGRTRREAARNAVRFMREYQALRDALA